MTTAADDTRHLRIRLIILGGLMLALIAAGLSEIQITLARQPLGIDFLPLWTGARLARFDPSRLYDFAFVSDAQDWILRQGYGLRPFVYPPTTLAPLQLFAGLPFWVAYPEWTVLTAGAMAWMMVKIAPERRVLALLLLALASPCVTAALTGQTSFLIATFVGLSLWQVKTRPIVAGVLLGLAATMKPTALLLAPVCLVAGGHYKALISAGLTALVVAVLAVLLYGLQPWFDWLAALPRFQSFVFGNDGLLRGTITPASQAVAMGASGPVLIFVRTAFALAALIMAWRVFRATDALAPRIVALVGAGLFVTPYTMQYDATLLAPAVVLIVLETLETRRWTFGFSAYVLLIGTGIAHLGAYALVALVGLITARHIAGSGPRLAAARP